MGKKLKPIHPGEHLREDFMKPLGLSSNALAQALEVTPARINEILRQRRGISADTALRLGTYFGVSPELWLNLQADYDLRVIKRTRGEEIERRVRKRHAA